MHPSFQHRGGCSSALQEHDHQHHHHRGWLKEQPSQKQCFWLPIKQMQGRESGVAVKEMVTDIPVFMLVTHRMEVYSLMVVVKAPPDARISSFYCSAANTEPTHS